MSRAALWMVVLASCATETPHEDAPYTPPSRSPCNFRYCADGTIYEVEATEIPAHVACAPVQGAIPFTVGTCPSGCAVSGYYRDPIDPCNPTIYTCSDTTSCSAGQSHPCTASMRCGAVETGSCTCDETSWSCVAACSDGLCSPSEVQTALVGSWTGLVPGTASTTTFTIDSHGDFTTTSYAFPHSTLTGRFTVQAQTATGASGTIDLGDLDRSFTNMRVEADRLQFTFANDFCTDALVYDLQREN